MDATCAIQDSIHVFSLVRKYVSRILGTYHFLEVAFYISFFPKVISGPIVLWENFQVKLKERKVNLENIEKGILRIIYGLAKKVILADYFGSVIYKIQDNAGAGG